MSSSTSHDRLSIGGEWVPRITVGSANTGEEIGSVPEAAGPTVTARSGPPAAPSQILAVKGSGVRSNRQDLWTGWDVASRCAAVAPMGTSSLRRPWLPQAKSAAVRPSGWPDGHSTNSIR
jgi:hypothetical protein